MDGFFRILKKTSFQLFCTRLYYVLLKNVPRTSCQNTFFQDSEIRLFKDTKVCFEDIHSKVKNLTNLLTPLDLKFQNRYYHTEQTSLASFHVCAFLIFFTYYLYAGSVVLIKETQF